MAGKGVTLLLGSVAVVLVAGVSLAVDCTVCDECSADPAFVQRDLRNPEMLPIVKRLASKRIRDEGLKIVVVLSEAQGACCEDEDDVPRSLVLIGSEGSVEGREIKGGLPAEVRSFLGLRETEDKQVGRASSSGKVLEPKKPQ
ncbi:MAG: hypothetical protein AMS16_00135 [Planctomycetes bacterium DG_58]|nr:MAG: hypothetical protein AMS16_00135 [Planctomycetes bacterium DG_58]